jgi:branched-chain amino acid transport system permease protein
MNQNLRFQLLNLSGLVVVLAAWTLYAVYASPTQGWTFFFQLTVNGIILGSVYALIALGYTMVYGILKLLNFAHGDVFMIGAFVAFGVLTLLGGAYNPAIPAGAGGALILLCMFAAAMGGSGLLGVAIERFAYRPLRDAPRIAPLISALGVSFFLQNSALLLFSANFRSYETFNLIDPIRGIHEGPLNISIPRILTVVSAALLMVSLTLLVARTRIGKAMRATSFDREAASMMGIDVDRVIVFTFFIGSALAGAAGVMFGLVFSQIYHLMGFLAGLKGFTAAVVGGIGSIPGAMLGGLLIGLAEAYTAGYWTSTFQDLVVFALLIVVMLIRPRGLLGRADIQKV